MKRLIIFFLSLSVWLPLVAQQITGVVTDAETGEAIPFASVIYKGHQVAVVSDINGQYTIPWGYLTDKNNPLLSQNAGSSRLMYFPDGANVIDPGRPYTELVLGVHNIFKFFHVEYVRRLNYNSLPTSPKWGMRYVIAFSF